MVSSEIEKQQLSEGLAVSRQQLGEAMVGVRGVFDFGRLGRYLARSVRDRIYIWMSFAAIGGWILSRLPKKKVYVRTPETNPRVGGQRAGKGNVPSGVGSLAAELIAAVGLPIFQRKLNVWLRDRFAKRRAAAGRQAASRNVRRERPGPAERAGAGRKTKTGQRLSGKFSLARAWDLIKRTAGEWNDDKCPQLGAALAYYTVFSLAPLVLVLLAVFGFIFGSSEQARDRLTDQLRYLVDPSAVKVIQDIAANVSKPKGSILASIIGVVVALFGASGVFGQLQDALNTIWGVKPKPGQGVWGFLRSRFLSFGMVGGVCFLLLVSLTLESLLRAFSSYLKEVLPGGDALALAVFFVFDLAVIILLLAMLFRYLPDAKVAWRDVWIGAVLTAVLFVIGKFVLGLYLGSGAAGSAYGAASSLITLLLWVFYSAQIVLFGAEFTQVYANAYGSHVEPEEYAVKVERKEVEVPSGGR